MKKLIVLLVAGAMLSLTGCVAGYTPSINMTDVTQVDFSKSSTWKFGEACQTQFLFFPYVGIASVKTAAEDAKITKVDLVDYNVQNYLIFNRLCVNVYGR